MGQNTTGEIRQDVAEKQADGSFNPLYKGDFTDYPSWPNRRLIDAVIIAYQYCDRTRDKFAEPPAATAALRKIPSTRFLFSDGTIRKWTKWYKISYGERANLINVWEDIPNVEQKIVKDDWLFGTPFQIMLSKDGNFQNISAICPGTNSDLVANVFYDDKFVPYKTVKPYGEVVPLRGQVTKLKSGIVTWGQTDFVDNPKMRKGNNFEE